MQKIQLSYNMLTFTHCASANIHPLCQRWVARNAAPTTELGFETAFRATQLDTCRLGSVSAKSRYCKLKPSRSLAKT